MTREDLMNYLNNKKVINGMIEEYIEQKTKVEGIRAVVLDGMPKAQNKPSYAVEQLLDEYNKIIDYLKEQQNKQNEIVMQLEKMDNAMYKAILFYKYIKGRRLEEVSVELDRDYKYICNLHGYALNEFDKINQFMWKNNVESRL